MDADYIVNDDAIFHVKSGVWHHATGGLVFCRSGLLKRYFQMKVMKMKVRIILLLFLLLGVTKVYSLTDQDEKLLGVGMDCYESNNLLCAKENFETALDAPDSEMNHNQRRSIKKMLYGVYFGLAQIKADSGIYVGIEEYCEKGISLGVELGKVSDYAAKSFYVWYTISMINARGVNNAEKLAGQLREMQKELASNAGDQKVSTLAQPNPNPLKVAAASDF
ncbi:MAG: hypothetical protein DIZ78_17080 [endosymbiont of Escarpia spicata]|uniref:Uncharacterized protein n=1 Tax=endosymbiont of Escarpia spicata TaxID=2200908 RepID=A0A370DB58_9GAMM|nr:MAG: hypothetical protein DIZ78_17080 [endosymbiont of Escarpia spicata]